MNFVDSLTYDDEKPWPAEADGSGSTLELKDPNLDNSLAINWSSSTPYGTPGKINSALTSNNENTIPVLPSIYSLSQNYPNPFNPITNINFTLPDEGRVKIELFNVLGQKIQTLIDEDKRPGFYQVSFDGAYLSSGFYFYRMKTEKYVQIKKMLLLK
jgi:hypothetical protein